MYWISRGAAPGHIVPAFSSRLIRYINRKLLAKDLIENRSLFAETFPPKVQPKGRELSIFFVSGDRWSPTGIALDTLLYARVGRQLPTNLGGGHYAAGVEIHGCRD